MKFSLVNVLVLQGVAVNAHYLWSRLLINGAVSPDWQYFRTLPKQPDDPSYGYDTRINPIYDVETLDIRCNRGGSTAGAGVQTAKLQAGDMVGFGRTTNASFPNNGYETNEQLFHSGPAALYLSKAPGDLESYTGDGDWFKIGQYGAKNSQRWELAENIEFINFTIPATIPPGKYLMRMEFMFPRSPYPLERMQFYVGCAHAEISGPGGGSPGPMIKFPGDYKNSEPYVQVPGEWATYSIITGKSKNLDNPKWKNPGPAVWSG